MFAVRGRNNRRPSGSRSLFTDAIYTRTPEGPILLPLARTPVVNLGFVLSESASLLRDFFAGKSSARRLSLVN